MLDIGHPEIIVGDAKYRAAWDNNVERLIKCAALPPQNLFYPVLPFRMVEAECEHDVDYWGT